MRRIWIIAAVVLLAIDLYVALYEIYLYGVCSGRYFLDIDILFNLHRYKNAISIKRGDGLFLLLDSSVILLNAVFVFMTLLLKPKKRQ